MRNQRIIGHFNEAADLIRDATEHLAPQISSAVELMFSTIAQGNRILVYGEGASSIIGQQLSVYCVGRFERERLPLPVVSLADLPPGSGGLEGKLMLQRQIHSLGQPGDLLLVAGASGHSAGLVVAMQAARDREMRMLALVSDGNPIVPMLNEEDVYVNVPHVRNARIHEMHMLIIHCLCDGVDAALLGGTVDEQAK